MIIGAGGLAAGFALGSVMLLAILTTTLRHTADDQARSTAREVAMLIGAGALPEPVPVAGPSIVQVVDAQERIRAASSTADRLVPLLDSADLVRARSGRALEIDGDRIAIDGPLRVVGLPAGTPDDPQTVLVAVPIAQSLQSVHFLQSTLIVVYPLLVGGLSILAWRVVGATLRPVEDLRAGAERITSSRDSEARLPVPEGGDEIHRLAVTLNQMLDRLESARARQRTFVADAAHELRSPLANLTVQLEVTQQHGGALPVEDLLADVERLTRLTDDLLLLARADAPRAVAFVAVDLSASAADVVARYSTARVPVLCACDGPLWVDGDPSALDRVIVNLVDNAVRHAASSVTVSVSSGPGSVVLIVIDDGPGIPAADRDRVFERFTRLDDARTRDAGGSGLGLAIVRNLVQQQGGTVALAPAATGTCMRVTLPRRASPPALPDALDRGSSPHRGPVKPLDPRSSQGDPRSNQGEGREDQEMV
jgi:signal transduction histidine kinase